MPDLDDVLAGYDKAPRELKPIGTALGQGLASIINAFNPEVVVLGGYFSALYDLVGREIETAVAGHTLPAAGESVHLRLPALGQDSILLGAAEMAFEPLFTDPVSALSDAIQDVSGPVAG